MARKYDSSRRKQAAAETRRKILEAALKLHWEGITEFAPLAEEADCSLPTLRKYYPTKESLFRDCTRTFAESLDLPDLEAIAQLPHPEQRLEQGIAELCRIHEAMFGYAWHSGFARRDSPTLDAEMQAYEGLADAVTDLLAGPTPAKRPALRGLLDYLTYRAFRLSGDLSAEEVRLQLITLARLHLEDDARPSATNKKEPDHDHQ